MIHNLVVCLAGLALDRVIGEPAWLWRRLPHPVVLFGAAIGAAERRLNRTHLPQTARRALGVVAILGLLALAAGVGGAVSAIAEALPGGIVFEIAVAGILLAHHSLIAHVRAVRDALAAEGLPGGRRAVSMIVGRETEVLDEAGVSRAAIESAAENFSDGVVAPAAFLVLLGLPGLVAYKMLNTADSMIGHRDERFAAFGWAAARLDDLANLLPARLSALLIALAAGGGMRGARTALVVALRDARRHRSPNAGWPEAAMAAGLGLALGGPRRYGDLVVDGAWLNHSGRAEVTGDDIGRAIVILDRAAVLHAAIYGAALLVLLAFG